jgi:hypothetical protein
VNKTSDDTLEMIYGTLEEIKSLKKLTNQDKLQAVKDKLLKPGTVKEEVYNLCDESKTIEEMAQSLGKDSSYVRSYLSILRREGFIQNVIKDKRQVYRQTF